MYTCNAKQNLYSYCTHQYLLVACVVHTSASAGMKHRLDTCYTMPHCITDWSVGMYTQHQYHHAYNYYHFVGYTYTANYYSNHGVASFVRLFSWSLIATGHIMVRVASYYVVQHCKVLTGRNNYTKKSEQTGASRIHMKHAKLQSVIL